MILSLNFVYRTYLRGGSTYSITLNMLFWPIFLAIIVAYHCFIERFKEDIFHSFVSNFRSHLVHDGIATLPNFLRNDVLCKAVAQIRSLTYKAWKTDSSHNIFLDDGDEDFPMDHIRNRRLPTTVNWLNRFRYQEY